MYLIEDIHGFTQFLHAELVTCINQDRSFQHPAQFIIHTVRSLDVMCLSIDSGVK